MEVIKKTTETEMEPLKLEDEDGKAENIDSFETLLEIIRPMGAWQIRIYILLAMIQYLNGMMNVAVAFYQIEPEAACVVPNASDVFHQMSIKQQLILSSPSHMAKEVRVYDHCRYYNRNYSEENLEILEHTNITTPEGESTLAECTKWVFNRTNNMYPTAVTQYSLMCQWKFGVELSQTVHMIGYMIGSLIAGYISDRFGRCVTTAVGGMATGILGCLLVVAPSYSWFVLVRFLHPFALIAVGVATYVMAMETTSSRWRVIVGGGFFLPYAFGYMSMAGVAALTRDWRQMHVVISAPAVLSILFLWLLPESPRWLLNRGDVTAAEKVVRAAAKANGAKLPVTIDFHRIATNLNKKSSPSNKSLRILFRLKNGKLKYPKMLVHTLNLCFNWLANRLVYCGILLNISSFAGNVFLNNAIGGAIEIPACLLTIPLLYWGRRNSLALLLFMAGISLFVVPWITGKSADTLRFSVAMFGKLCIATSFAVVYTITGEMYPTEIRSSGLAFGYCISMIGASIAPFISSLHKVNPGLRWLTMVIFGSFSVVAAVLTLFLPETKDAKLAETLDDTLIDGDKSAVDPAKILQNH